MMTPDDALVADIREALRAYRATGARFQNTQHLTLLARGPALRKPRHPLRGFLFERPVRRGWWHPTHAGNIESRAFATRR
jgi:hypothetical protein